MADFGAEGADLEGIVALRDVADADKLVSLISSTKEAGGKVIVLRKQLPAKQICT